MPRDAGQITETKASFPEYTFANVTGVMDCTHIVTKHHWWMTISISNTNYTTV